ncbi:MAG: ABC transporter ATP-binding protein [Candidatus Bipolaricaulota bacterium]|nr:ABC transporter ATP-binding protein [Candidatus Bipolaricaulota bacterium]MCS7274018.1 ABC transporter ATP-binding protein [Candidatus Bipolaricaulota bacterium]MDW8111371.1 ABC transporter ATP-binding protein [Candidatus Bipolaricaulota bacterium]MDW8329913.1 ABC transporter ATP-binding protein [Candidatus Bipolaricaulota bacterium]
MSEKIIIAKDLVKTYENGRTRALDGVSLEIVRGEAVAICGPSGSGKSTLLNLIGALDRPDSGELFVAGEDLVRQRGDLADFRARKLGFIFQLHHLIPSLTALENVLIPTLGVNGRDPEATGRATALLERVGLQGKFHRKPPELSGGERQRVAVARALINNPELILADEPTGSLDSKTERQVLELLYELCRERGATLLLVTHDPRVAQSADRVIEILDGRVKALAAA